MKAVAVLFVRGALTNPSLFVNLPFHLQRFRSYMLEILKQICVVEIFKDEFV